MFLANVVVTTCTCLCLVKYVPVTVSQEDATHEEEEDVQQKIALIDIVFTNGKKRTCTGAIIHDNVVITAGHCLAILSNSMGPVTGMKYTKPELTASFVVIGDKKKFATGYEQYLPIERVVMHQNIKGFHSDIALVHTFASMTADKIGTVMPLITQNNSFQSDYNITVYSWGRITVDDMETDAEDPDNSCVDRAEDHLPECKVEMQDFRGHVQYMSDNGGSELKHTKIKVHKHNDSLRTKHSTAWGPYGVYEEKLNILRTPIVGSTLKRKEPIAPTTKVVSRYLSSGEKKTPQPKIQPQPVRHRFMKINRNISTPISKEENDFEIITGDGAKIINEKPRRVSVQIFTGTGSRFLRGRSDENYTEVLTGSGPQSLRSELMEEPMKILRGKPLDTRKTDNVQNDAKGNQVFINRQPQTNPPSKRTMQNVRLRSAKKSHLKSWRRQMGAKEINKLTVESFKFLNASACKKIIDKQQPKLRLNPKEIVCYVSENHYVTDEDSGAPAVNQGELVAITAGSIPSEGNNRVAIGMSLEHFCSWVAENLPTGDLNLNCWTALKNESRYDNDFEDSYEETESPTTLHPGDRSTRAIRVFQQETTRKDKF